MTKTERLRARFASGMSEARISDDEWQEEFLPMLEDAARYRWLCGRMFVKRNAAVPDRYGLNEYLLSEDIDEADDSRYIDAAIDAARSEETP